MLFGLPEWCVYLELPGRALAGPRKPSAEVDSPYPCGLRGSTRLVLGCGGTRFAGPAEMRDLSPAISWIEPVLKSDLEPLEHLLFDVFDVSELGPTSKITAFRGPSISTINSSTNPSLSGYFSRRCCLQMSAVCLCRCLVPRPIYIR